MTVSGHLRSPERHSSSDVGEQQSLYAVCLFTACTCRKHAFVEFLDELRVLRPSTTHAFDCLVVIPQVGSPVAVTATTQGRALTTPNVYTFTVNDVDDNFEILGDSGNDTVTGSLRLTGPFSVRQVGIKNIMATLALLEGAVYRSIDSPVVEVNFVPPKTTLSAPTSTPKVGDTTAITATVVAATGEGGTDKPIKDAKVTFTVKTSGGRSLPTVETTTGKHTWGMQEGCGSTDQLTMESKTRLVTVNVLEYCLASHALRTIPPR